MTSTRQLPMLGGCACGKVRYEVTEKPMFMGNCHCRSCQKSTGAAYLPIVGVNKNAFHLTGEVKQFATQGQSGKNVNRHFCPNCGSLVFGQPEILSDFISISASTLDDPSQFTPQLNMWVEAAQPWDHIDETIPSFKQNPEM